MTKFTEKELRQWYEDSRFTNSYNILIGKLLRSETPKKSFEIKKRIEKTRFEYIACKINEKLKQGG